MPADTGDELRTGLSWFIERSLGHGRAPTAGSSSNRSRACDRRGGVPVAPWLAPPCPVRRLCTQETCSSVEHYLNRVCGRPCTSISDPALPVGWRLFSGVVPTSILHDVPRELEALRVGAHYEITFRGGLRLGRGAAWLAGAPPSVMLAGDTSATPPRFDGEPVDVRDDGELDLGSKLHASGEHTVEVGPIRRRVAIVMPKVHEALCKPLIDAEGPCLVALPGGVWTLIGARTDEVVTSIDAGGDGAVAYPTFRAEWAISSTRPRRGAVLCLSRDSATPKGGDPDLTEQQYSALDQITKTEPEPQVVGIVGEVAPGFHGWPPIIRYPSGRELALTSTGELVSPDALPPLAADAPQRTWAAAVCGAGARPARLGTIFDGAKADGIRNLWSAYHDAAVALEHHWNRAG